MGQCPPRLANGASRKRRAVYQSDVSAAEWELCRSFLPLNIGGNSATSVSSTGDVNALRYIARAGVSGVSYSMISRPERWFASRQHWMRAGCVEIMAHDLREMEKRRPTTVACAGSAVVVPGEQRTSQLQRTQGQQGERGGGHLGISAGRGGDVGQSASRRACLRGPRLYRTGEKPV